MSKSPMMEWKGRKVNLREEEKILDDKLMEIGLLEPGMSIDEKRELASVLLESSRMAEELNQKKKEKEWESIALPDENSKNKAGTSKRKVREDKNSFLPSENKDKNTLSSLTVGQSVSYREKSQTLKQDEIIRRKDDVRGKHDVEQHPVVKDDEIEEIIVKRDVGGRERRQRERRKGDSRKVEDVVISDDDGKEKTSIGEKPLFSTEKLEKSDKEKCQQKGEIPKTSFYGPPHLVEANNPNPFSSELYGNTKKRSLPKNNNLLKLLEEDMRRKLAVAVTKEKSSAENEQNLKSEEGRSTVVKESSKQTNFINSVERGSVTTHEKDTILKDVKDEDTGSVTKDNRLSIFPKREIEIPKDENRTKRIVSLALSSISDVKNQEEDTTGEKRRRDDPSCDSSFAPMTDDNEEGKERTPSSYVRTPDEKKRKLEKSRSSRKWSDVAAGNNLPEKAAEEENLQEMKFKKMMPNKRWRRVKRNFKSSFGSGSEVDEWISSDEDKKVAPKLLTKEQVVARLDNNLMRIKKALQKHQSSGLQDKKERVKNHVCCKMKYKVPPGFQEPDSDDDYNLWKICFGDKLTTSSKLESEESKSENSVSASKAIITRSRARQRNSISPSLSSKSISSVEERGTSSPLCLSPLKEILPGPSTNSDQGQSESKSPSSKEIPLNIQVTCSDSKISRATQTGKESDTESEQSSCSTALPSNPPTKSNEVVSECKPMWDLFEAEEDKKDEEIEIEDNSIGDEIQQDLINCPICNRAFPMDKIEVHASVCNAEEEDSSDGEPFIDTRVGRGNHRSNRMLSETTEAGVSAASNRSEMDFQKEILGDCRDEEDDDYKPRPAKIVPFVPISQQKNSYINYHDQFPEVKSNANLQASILKIRQKLMRSRPQRKGWKRRKKGRAKKARK